MPQVVSGQFAKKRLRMEDERARMPDKRLSVVVTRRLPEAVEARMSELFDVTLSQDDKPMSKDQLIAAVKDADVLVPTITDTIDAGILAQAGERLKLIANFGAGVDNIDVDYARSKGIEVVNTPGASSRSVAELVIAPMFSLARSLHQSNRSMPGSGNSEFKVLKKAYSKGFELKGKTLGVIGFGRIGRETASYALGAGMKVLAYDLFDLDPNIELDIAGAGTVTAKVESSTMERILEQSDIITVHIPAQDGSAVIDATAFSKMKDGVVLINAARGGVVDEEALVSAIENGKVRAAALDVFENEPHPNAKVLEMSEIALSPHIGAATLEAQDRIGIELADQIIAKFGVQNK